MSEEDFQMLSNKITDTSEYRRLGLEVLKQPDYQINATLYNHKQKVESAANEILLRWYCQLINPTEAYGTLYIALKKNKMVHLTVKLWFSMEPAGRVFL